MGLHQVNRLVGDELLGLFRVDAHLLHRKSLQLVERVDVLAYDGCTNQRLIEPVSEFKSLVVIGFYWWLCGVFGHGVSLLGLG